MSVNYKVRKMNVVIEKINKRKERRLDILEELVKSMHQNTGELLGVIEEIRYLEFLKDDIKI